jgi:hypothetical protein
MNTIVRAIIIKVKQFCWHKNTFLPATEKCPIELMKWGAICGQSRKRVISKTEMQALTCSLFVPP